MPPVSPKVDWAARMRSGSCQSTDGSSVFESATRVAAARAIARDIRAANGGLHGVKALGVLAGGRAQVSMNITDFRVMPVRVVHERVCALARKHGAATAEGELIGLVPEEAFGEDLVWVREIPRFVAEEKVLERKLHRPMSWPEIEA